MYIIYKITYYMIILYTICIYVYIIYCSVSVFFLSCFDVCAPQACLRLDEEEFRSFGTRVTDGSELHSGCWESNSSSLEEQQMLFTIESFLQTHRANFQITFLSIEWLLLVFWAPVYSEWVAFLVNTNHSQLSSAGIFGAVWQLHSGSCSEVAPLTTLFLWSSWHLEEDHITTCPTEEARLHKWSSRSTLCPRYTLGCCFDCSPLRYSLPPPYSQGHCQLPVMSSLLHQPHFCI